MNALGEPEFAQGYEVLRASRADLLDAAVIGRTGTSDIRLPLGSELGVRFYAVRAVDGAGNVGE